MPAIPDAGSLDLTVVEPLGHSPRPAQQPQPATSPHSPGPLQTCPPQPVFKGLLVVNFNSDQVVTVPLHEVNGAGSHCAVQVRGNYCAVSRMVIRVTGDGESAAGPETAQRKLATLQSLRHPHLACLMGARMHPLEQNMLAVDIFLPNYRCSLAEALQLEACDGGGHPLGFDTRVRILTGLLSALVYLHSREPPLTGGGGADAPLVACETVRLDAFFRPALYGLEHLVEVPAANEEVKQKLLLRDHFQLYSLSIELITGRLKQLEPEVFRHYAGSLVNQFLQLTDSQSRHDFDNEHDILDCRLAHEDEEDDGTAVDEEVDSNLRMASVVWSILRWVVSGRLEPAKAFKQLLDCDREVALPAW